MDIRGFSMELLLMMHGVYTLVSQNLLIDYLSYTSIMTSKLYADSMRESVMFVLKYDGYIMDKHTDLFRLWIITN